MKKKITSLIAFMLCVAATTWAQSTVKTFTLKNSADGKSEIKAFLPPADKATGRAIVACPGGGYAFVAMEHEGTNWAQYFNDQGIALFVVNYRLPKGDRSIPISDAKNAIQTVRDSAKVWNVNPHDVGIMGSSAGGHLASTISTHSDAGTCPDFTILFYPVISMNEKTSHQGSVIEFLGEGRKDNRLVQSYSNHLQVKPKITPPCIILLSYDDNVVPPITNGIAYSAAMHYAGNSCALYVYPSGGHGWGFNSDFKYHNQMLADLREWLENLPSQ
jgi:acetyl esterase/lipase